MSKRAKNHEMLERLANVFVEDVFSATDEEILKETAEDCVDPAQEVKNVKAVFEKARIVAAKKRLLAAKEAVRQEKQHSRKVLPLDAASARRKLDNILREYPEAGEGFTLAARKSQDLSDTDVLGMLEDLRELGIYKPENDPE